MIQACFFFDLFSSETLRIVTDTPIYKEIIFVEGAICVKRWDNNRQLHITIEALSQITQTIRFDLQWLNFNILGKSIS